MTDKVRGIHRSWRAARVLMVLALTWGVPGTRCTAATAAAADEVNAQADLRVTAAWIRWLPAGLPGAGYMVIANGGNRSWSLTGAHSAAYGRIEFHRSAVANGMSAMTPVAAVAVPSRATVVFGEGGYHLMLMQPTRPIRPGEQIVVTLEFAGGRTLDVPFAVRGAADAQ